MYDNAARRRVAKNVSEQQNTVSKHEVWEDKVLHLNRKVTVDLQEGSLGKSFLLVSLLTKLYKNTYHRKANQMNNQRK